MDTLRLVVAIVATIVAVPAAFALARTELGIAGGRTRARRALEVAAPPAGLVALLVIVWASL